MRLLPTLAKAALLCVLVPLLLQRPVQAQELAKPVMQNVFFNVVWGSALGATLGVASAVIGSDDPSSPEDVRGGAFTGATAGGLIGLGIALYLVYQGITFDEGSSTVGAAGEPPGGSSGLVASTPPFSLVTAPGHPGRVTGFSARIFELRF